MPELPEVETVRRGLQASVCERTVASVAVTGARSVRRQAPEALVELLVGRRVERVDRRGKYLLARLDDEAVLIVHLRMSGQLVFVPPGAGEVALAAHTHVRIAFEDGAELRFVDPRTFGELFVTDELDERSLPVVLSGLGDDPLHEGIDCTRLARLASTRRTSLKAFLLDQGVLCGIGNLYADEACFRARLRPTRAVASLRPIELKRLADALSSVLAEAIEAGGSTLRDARYLDLFGNAGSFQERHHVYGRANEPCTSCGRPLNMVRVAGRSTHFCGACQR